MGESIKSLKGIKGFSYLRTSVGLGGVKGLSHDPVIELFMRRNQRERLIRELRKTRRREILLQRKLREVEKGMSKLLEKVSAQIKGKSSKSSSATESKREGRSILKY